MKVLIKKLLSESDEISSNRVMYILWNVYIMLFLPVLVFFGYFDELTAWFIGGVMATVWSGKGIQKGFEQRKKNGNTDKD